jgi:arabinan endo-1,5-alpha-L-arabinosidase
MLYHRKMKLILSTIAVLTLIAALIVIQGLHITSTHAAAASPNITISGSIGAHDPSRMIKDGNTYYVYATGYDIPSLTSTDRIHWSQGQTVLPNGTQSWARTAVPGNDGHDIWAPDVIYNNGLFYLYYAISGGKTCAIGLVTSPTLNPQASNYKWTDRGEVIGSTPSNRYSTIDPAPFFDASGNMWLSWGSGYVFTWSDPEVFVIRLNKSTGLRADNTLYPLENGHIEASYVQYYNGFYYLFWNTGGCCSGTASTYLIHVARSSSVTGPYVDKSGNQNSSDTFLASSGLPRMVVTRS